MLTACLALIATQLPIDVVAYQSPEPFEIPFRTAWKDTVAVQVKIKGKDAWFMLDTGAAGTFLTRKLWKNLGLPTDEESVGVEVACGTVTALLEVGKVPQGLEAANEKYGMKLDGVLGLDFLDGCAVGIDRPSQAIVLFPPRVLGADRLRIWFGSVASVKDGKPRWMPWTSQASLVGEKSLSPIEFEQTQMGAQVFDAPPIEQRLGVTVNVGGVKMDCVFDTGACPTTLLESPIKSLVRFEPDKVINYSIEGTQYISRGRLDSLKLGDYELAPTGGLTVCTTDNPVLRAQGLIGSDVFARHKTLLDFANHTVAFARYRKNSAGQEQGRYYIAEIYDPETKQILRFHTPSSFPFRQGDIVLSGASRIKVMGAKDGLTTLKIE